MKKIRKGLLATLVSIFSATSTSVVAAQDVPGKGGADDAIEEVVITASRRSENLQDVGMSVSVVDPADYVDIGLTSITDVIDYTPGFSFNSQGQRGAGSIVVRGIGQLGDTAATAIYLDDTPMTGNSPFANSARLYFDGLLGDIERIELLRGPQGTLYGATSIGGAIKYITRKPTLDNVRGKLSVSIADIHEGGTNNIYSGFVSLPLIQDTLGLTIAGFKEENDGFVDQIDGTGNVIAKDADNSESEGISADLLWNISDAVSLRLRYLDQETEFGLPSQVDLAGESRQPAFDDYQTTDQVGSRLNTYTAYSGTLDIEMDWATLTSTSSVVEFDGSRLQDITNLVGGLADLIQGLSPGTTTFAPLTRDSTSEKFVQEVRLTSAESDTIEWILGLYYVDEETTNDQTIITQPNAFNLATIMFPSEYEEYAVFGNLTYKITDNFDVTLGMRYSDNETSIVSDSSGPLVGDAEVNDSFGETTETYLLAARYRPRDDLSLYARIASGYRPGTANLPVAGLPSEPVKSDVLWSYEVGAKGSLADGQLDYDVAVWYIEFDDFQADVTSFGVAGVGNADGGITGSGLDASFTLKPTENFSLLANLAYADSTIDDDEPSVEALAGQSMPGVPEWSVSALARYDFDLTDDLNGYISTGFRFIDSKPSAFENATSNRRNLPTAAYSLWDLSAGVELESYRVSFFVTNLFDEVAYATTNVSPPLFVASPIQPRTMGVSFTYNYQ